MEEHSEFLTRLNNIESLIKEQNLPQKEIFTLKEACEYLDISTSFMYKLTHQKRIVHFCPNGKKLVFRKDDLSDYLLKNRRATIDEIEANASKYIMKGGSRS